MVVGSIVTDLLTTEHSAAAEQQPSVRRQERLHFSGFHYHGQIISAHRDKTLLSDRITRGPLRGNPGRNNLYEKGREVEIKIKILTGFS